MTYPEAIQFLYSLRLFGTKLGLENTFKLAAAAGNPQDHLRFIHVAGTNGKGSTCAMLESIYRAAGLRVGLFTSPHLVSFGERIQVNRQPISQEDVVRLVSEVQALLDCFPAEAHPTFFEVITIMALRFSVAEGVNITSITQLFPEPIVAPVHVSPISVKSLLSSPSITTLFMYNFCPPVFVTTTLWGLLRRLAT